MINQLRIRTDLLRHHRFRLVIALLTALVSTAAALAVPLLVKNVIVAFTDRESVTPPIVAMVVAALVAAIASAGSALLLGTLGELMILRLRRRIISHTLRLPVHVVRAEGAGNLVARVTSDAMLLRGIIDVGVVQLPLAVLTVLVTLIVMTILDWVLVLITVASFAVAGAAIWIVLRQVKRNVIDQQNALGELAQQFTAHLAALLTIKACRCEELAAKRLGQDAGRLTMTALTGTRLQSLIAPVMGLGQQVALVSVIIGGGARIATGALSLPDFAAFLIYLLQLVSPIAMAASGVGRLQAGLAALSRFNGLLALPPEADRTIASGPIPEPVPGAAAVEFDHVSFAYQEAPTISGLTFTMPRIGLTALVGPSGAGKSTTLGLVDRFSQASGGRITVLGHDINTWPLAHLRRRVSYVDQQFTLLEGTVRENLVLGTTEEVGEDELLDALAAVGLREDIAALPEGLDTILGRENDLSGGQRQRLALARALLTDSEIVLLDEPTSQMDNINEERFRRVVDDLARTRSVLIVAHRLSTVQHAKHVLMMDAGRIVGSGAHHDLMDTCDAYREMVLSQTDALTTNVHSSG